MFVQTAEPRPGHPVCESPGSRKVGGQAPDSTEGCGRVFPQVINERSTEMKRSMY
jgi:hypothetical protein